MPDYGRECPCCGAENPGAVPEMDGFRLTCCGAFDPSHVDGVRCPDGDGVAPDA